MAAYVTTEHIDTVRGCMELFVAYSWYRRRLSISNGSKQTRHSDGEYPILGLYIIFQLNMNTVRRNLCSEFFDMLVYIFWPVR